MKLSKLGSLFLPQGLVWGQRYLKRKLKRFFLYRMFDWEKYKVTQKNKELKDLHKGERVFILGTDLSIENTDIKLLKNEKKIFMSQFFLHEEYNDLNPEYHLFNSYGGHPYIDQKVILEHYRQIDAMIKDGTTLFFRYAYDYDFIKKHNLFENKKVYYIEYDSSIPYIIKDGLDATIYFYPPQGCLMYALQLAVFMGFKEVYLVGCGSAISSKDGRSHFYDRSKSTVDPVVEKSYVEQLEKNKNKTDLELHVERFKMTVQYAVSKRCISIFESYDSIKKYSRLKGVNIYNLTKYSMIDVFPYVELESLFK